MKKFSIIIFLLLQTASIFALDVPYLSGRVVDEAGILSEETKSSLEKKLIEQEKKTSNQLVVLTIPSLEGEVLEDYSIKVATTWKLGQKGKDNGVLLLIAKDDRKLRIEVGYGLEGTLTDVMCSRIIRNEITPSFKRGDFSGGVEKGVDSILAVIDGSYVNTSSDSTTSNDSGKDTNIEGVYSKFIHSVGDSDIPFLFRIPFGLIFFTVITPFTILTAVTPYVGWFLYFFLMPFYGTFPVVIFGKWGGLFLPSYIVIMFFLKLYFGFTKDGKKLAEKIEQKYGGSGGSGGSSSGSSWSSRSSGGFSSGGFSGGGGSFGGGGSSGSW
ncbi:MAG TPA: TPM domain-containing protein [Leptospiraceae bacterium]|nr:TPM domain-containing protein [Leptospiraceae bacterium]HMW07380.1 TPM domain-containing protein [Leptospiraceae bacterium]HMX34243.1 TPM domain-containing protein [Leptospiraceae bacterium]HMY32444.1 TPM domain-containing protein [Leptospiraceae bacterium]HMZ64199.1 TPM domain-containing protein [Leptospiraceae bacterium]